ncbi:Myb/SANT-like domain-containing protein [Tanacetum coccineum]
MARPVHPSAVYQSPTMTYPSTTYQSAPVVHPPSAYTPTTNAPPTYQFAPAHPASHFQFAPTTNPLPAYQYASTTHHSPSHQSSPTTHSTLPRGRGKNKCFWEESETELLLDVLQDMANDPSWKTDNGFRSNYLGEVHRRILAKRPDFAKIVSPHIESKVKWLKTKFHVINDMLKQSGCSWNDVEKKVACEKQWFDNYCKNHKEAKGLWDVPFPYFNKLELVYGKDRATGIEAEGFEDAIHNLENEFNAESGGDNLGESHFSLSDDEENDVQYMPQTTQTTSNFTNATKTAKKRKATFHENKAGKKRKTQEARLEGIDHTFQMFVQGFNANFGTMANAVAHAMTDENTRQKAANEKLKDVLVELMKLKISSGDVLHAGEIFAAHKEKIDLFMSLPEELRLSYVYKLVGLTPGLPQVKLTKAELHILGKLALRMIRL